MENVKSEKERAVLNSETVQSDFELTQKVYETLQNDCFINHEKIVVRVKDHTVYLEGIVTSERERNLAYEAVTDIFGVRNVVNYLTYPCPYLIRHSA